MSWAIWLAVPIGATVLASLWAWLRARHGAISPERRADTRDAVAAHREYLDALTIPARHPRG